MATNSWKDVENQVSLNLSDAYTTFGKNLSNGLGVAKQALDDHLTREREKAALVVQQRLQNVTDPAAIQQLVGSGALFKDIPNRLIDQSMVDLPNQHWKTLMDKAITDNSLSLDREKLTEAKNKNSLFPLESDKLQADIDATKADTDYRKASTDYTRADIDRVRAGIDLDKTNLDKAKYDFEKIKRDYQDSEVSSKLLRDLTNSPDLATSIKMLESTTGMSEQSKLSAMNAILAKHGLAGSNYSTPLDAVVPSTLTSDERDFARINPKAFNNLKALEKQYGGKYRDSYSTVISHGAYGLPPKDIQDMNVSEIKDYQESLKNATKGKIKTSQAAFEHGTSPVGRYQVVGSTLDAFLKNRYGDKAKDRDFLSTLKFDKAFQDEIGQYLYDNRVKSSKSDDSLVANLRSEWEGLKSVSSEDILKANKEGFKGIRQLLDSVETSNSVTPDQLKLIQDKRRSEREVLATTERIKQAKEAELNNDPNQVLETYAKSHNLPFRSLDEVANAIAEKHKLPDDAAVIAGHIDDLAKKHGIDIKTAGSIVDKNINMNPANGVLGTNWLSTFTNNKADLGGFWSIGSGYNLKMADKDASLVKSGKDQGTQFANDQTRELLTALDAKKKEMEEIDKYLTSAIQKQDSTSIERLSNNRDSVMTAIDNIVKALQTDVKPDVVTDKPEVITQADLIKMAELNKIAPVDVTKETPIYNRNRSHTSTTSTYKQPSNSLSNLK